MLPGQGKYGIIISKIPVMQRGLKAIAGEHLPEYAFGVCGSPEELTLLQLRQAVLVIADLSGESHQLREVCGDYHSLMTQYSDIHWVYMVGHACDLQAMEILVCAQSTLVSSHESVKHLLEVIHADGTTRERISQMLLSAASGNSEENWPTAIFLTLSERKVLRLLAKGWGINQIAALLKKSNKTISAQKNSAMRRLSLRSNAQMYAWINSAQGMKELNIYAAFGEQKQWKKTPHLDMSLL